jgi:hypothetical protein
MTADHSIQAGPSGLHCNPTQQNLHPGSCNFNLFSTLHGKFSFLQPPQTADISLIFGKLCTFAAVKRLFDSFAQSHCGTGERIFVVKYRQNKPGNQS